TPHENGDRRVRRRRRKRRDGLAELQAAAGRQLDENEGQVAALPLGAPRTDERRQQVVVAIDGSGFLARELQVLLALPPHEAAHRVTCERRDVLDVVL